MRERGGKGGCAGREGAGGVRVSSESPAATTVRALQLEDTAYGYIQAAERGSERVSEGCTRDEGLRGPPEQVASDANGTHAHITDITPHSQPAFSHSVISVKSVISHLFTASTWSISSWGTKWPDTACVHAYVHACVHAYVRACVHAYVHVCVHAYVRACVHAYVRACVQVLRAQHSVCTCARLHVCVCVCVCVCARVLMPAMGHLSSSQPFATARTQ